jgi:hypothetical protein
MINFSIHVTGICNLGLVKNEKKFKFYVKPLCNSARKGSETGGCSK